MKSSRPVLFFLSLFFLILFSGCGLLSSNSSSGPVFIQYSDKIAQLTNTEFTGRLFNEALAFDPRLAVAGTQVHMGFWSGAGNRDRLIRVLDSINSHGQPAIWDEGMSPALSMRYPDYILMNREYWYERANAQSNQIIINGITFMNINPPTFAQADNIWGQYSKDYTDLAAVIKQNTGQPVMAWCFVIGANPNRIFYTYEYPELKILERQGAVRVFLAKNSNADWQNPSDWTEDLP